MSSIFGILPLKGNPLQPPAFEAMRTAMDHWHADQRNTWVDEPVALGHLMLYTTPESLRETLPYRHAELPLVITADARIDNREELWAKLGLGADQRHLPDSQLILLAYVKYGRECVYHLLGDFAFAIWDMAAQSLFCARDHMGVRPFFYYRHNDLFLFASEKKGILAVPDTDRSIDEQFFVNQLYHLAFQEIDTTLYRHIRRLPPAHTLYVNAATGTAQLAKYWELDADAEMTLSSDSDYYEGLRHHFEEAVKCRTRSAYTIGVELSGGLDSSAITGAIARLSGTTGLKYETFSQTLPPGITDPRMLWKDERKHFEEVLRFNQVEQANMVTENPFEENIQEIDFFLEVNDGMEAWNAILHVGTKKKVAERHIRTLISGFGGDQLVSSTHKYRRIALLEQKKYLAYFRGKGLISKLPAVLPYRLQEWLLDTFPRLHRDDYSCRETRRIYNFPARYDVAHRKLYRHYAPYRERYKSYRHLEKWRVHNPTVSFRAESENRYGYYFRHDTAYPLLDVRLMQFYLSSPLRIRMEGNLNRPYFRKAVFDLLPPAIQTRQDKIGGSNPFFYNRKRPYLDETTLTVERMPDNGLVNKQEVINRVNQIKAFREEWWRNNNKPSPQQNVILTAVESLRWIEKNPAFVKAFVEKG